jgi:hypothetical protein
MDFLTNVLHTVGSGLTYYVLAREGCYLPARLNLVAELQIAEIQTLSFLETLRDRAFAEGDSWLAEQITNHIKDEKRHVTIFAQMLKHHGYQLIDPLPPKFDQKQPTSFFDGYFKGYSAKDLKPENVDWLVFMGSAYILELDAGKDFAQLAKVIPQNDFASRSVKNGLLSIAQDEKRHAAYLYEAMQRRLSPVQVESLIEEWRARKVKAVWAAIGDMIQNGKESVSLIHAVEAETKKVDISLISA